MLKTIDPQIMTSPGEPLQELVQYQEALTTLGRLVYERERPVIIIFEGRSSSGKGEAIRGLTEMLDPRSYTVYAVHSPQGDNALHHYLWGFWRLLPKAGQIAVFDHSWYGRVLEDRVEGRCAESAWKRAYREINQFEQQLVDFGTILLKFWFQINREEQLRRLEAHHNAANHLWRSATNGWREQENWFLCQEAIDDMLLRTNTNLAPWTIIDATSTEYAQIKTLQTAVETLSRALGLDPFTDKANNRRIKGKSSKGKKKKRRS
jgi:polyphosphate kinase 2 (PPK2 family)